MNRRRTNICMHVRMYLQPEVQGSHQPATGSASGQGVLSLSPGLSCHQHLLYKTISDRGAFLLPFFESEGKFPSSSMEFHSKEPALNCKLQCKLQASEMEVGPQTGMPVAGCINTSFSHKSWRLLLCLISHTDDNEVATVSDGRVWGPKGQNMGTYLYVHWSET